MYRTSGRASHARPSLDKRNALRSLLYAWPGPIDRMPTHSTIWRATAALAALTWSATALAQGVPSPSQVQPPVIAPPPPTTHITLPQIAAGAAIPEAAKKLGFFLTTIDIDGEFDELAAKRRQLEAPLLGKRITVADLFAFADRLQQAYVQAGFPLVRIVILPQELDKRARVRLRVVDGYIERIDTSALADSAARRVAAVLRPVVGKRHLTQAELERQLLIAGEAPGLTLNATFAAGKDVGGSILVLTGRYRPVSASLYFDNGMPTSFGVWQTVTAVSFNNLSGFGEQVSLSAAGYPDHDVFTPDPTRRYLGATVVVPLGIDGWKFEIGATDGRTTPRVDPSVATLGLFQQGHVRLAYDALKRRDAELTFSARFDVTDEKLSTLVTDPSTPLSLDRLRVPRIGIDGVWRLRESGTTLTYGGTYSRGVNALGARMAADADVLLPLSRQGADAVFDKLDGRVDIMQSLPQNFFVSAGFAGQTSFNKPLLTSEQFVLTGANMLSAFPAGALAGDSAWVARGEIGCSASFPIGAHAITLIPYAFAAFGERIYADPTALELGDIHATNYGGGLRFQLSPSGDGMPATYSFIEFGRKQATASTLDGWTVFAGGTLRY